MNWKRQKQGIVLGPWDSIYIGANEGREIVNNTNKPVGIIELIPWLFSTKQRENLVMGFKAVENL